MKSVLSRVPNWLRELRGLRVVRALLNYVSVALRFLRRIFRHPAVAAVTPTGWAVLVGGVLAAVIGWNRGWLEFRTLAIMAAGAILIALLFTLRRSDHEGALELLRPRVHAGEEALGRVLVRPAKAKSGGVRMELPVGKAVASFRVGPMGQDDEHEEQFGIPTRRRGVIPLGPLRSVQADPLAILSRKRDLTEVVELFIHPRVVALEAGAIGMLKDVEGITTSNLSSSDVSFHALREYVPGDDRRAVHWRTTARVGRLMVRQFEETMRAHLLILLSTLRSDYHTEEDFEMAVSVAASIALAALREERKVSLHTSTGHINYPSMLGLLDEMSRIELVDRGSSLRSLAISGGGESGISVGAIVTGSTDPATLRGAQLALPPGVSTFAVRCAENQSLALRRVGELTVLDISSLDEIALAMRGVS